METKIKDFLTSVVNPAFEELQKIIKEQDSAVEVKINVNPRIRLGTFPRQSGINWLANFDVKLNNKRMSCIISLFIDLNSDKIQTNIEIKDNDRFSPPMNFKDTTLVKSSDIIEAFKCKYENFIK